MFLKNVVLFVGCKSFLVSCLEDEHHMIYFHWLSNHKDKPIMNMTFQMTDDLSNQIHVPIISQSNPEKLSPISALSKYDL